LLWDWQLPLPLQYVEACKGENVNKEIKILFFSDILTNATPFFNLQNENQVVLQDYNKLNYYSYTYIGLPDSDLNYYLDGFKIKTKKELIYYTKAYGLDWGEEGRETIIKSDTTKSKNKSRIIKSKTARGVKKGKNQKGYSNKNSNVPPPYSILTLRFNNQIQTNDGANSYIELFGSKSKLYNGSWYVIIKFLVI
jgi:hypothetical protein